MTVTEILRQCQSIDVLIGWQGPDLVEAGYAVAYISGANDLAVRGAIHADIVGVEDGDSVTLFDHVININNHDDSLESDAWLIFRPGFVKHGAMPLTMYRGDERIGTAVIFEVKR